MPQAQAQSPAENVAVPEQLLPAGGVLPEQAPVIAPVRQDERIVAMDTVRGFALLGILLLNILAFGLPGVAGFNPNVGGGATGWNLKIWFAGMMLFDGKLRAIFSMMFGASVYLLIDRLWRKGAAADAADIHYRRMLWMMLFGLIHGYLLWFGDVLYYYAIAGLFLYPLRKLSARALLIAAAILLFAMPVRTITRYYHFRNLHREFLQVQADEKTGRKLSPDQEKTKKEWNSAVTDLSPSAEQLKEEYQAHLGSWIAGFKYRLGIMRAFHGDLIYIPGVWWDVFFMMLIGMALVKMGVLTGQRSYAFYGWMTALCLGVGLTCGFLCAWILLKRGFTPESTRLSFVFYEPSRLAGLGYCAILLMIVKAGVLRGLTSRLAAIGQTAFSNYILTTLICLAIFEGYGFALFGKLQRWQLYEIVLGVWLLQLAISPVWLRYYRFGPLEWLWRSLTYWKKQPMRRRAVVPALGPPALAEQG